MQYIEAPSKNVAQFTSIFLAGGITHCPDWQNVVTDKLKNFDLTIYNPRRKVYPTEENPLREQIEWEYERLRSADIVSFWFSGGSLNPITLFELGSALERGQCPIVGVDLEYERYFDVKIQVALKHPELKICHSLDELAEEIKAKLRIV